jgi:hypothetical protein
MNDNPNFGLEKRLIELQKKSREIVRKLTTCRGPAAPKVPGGKELDSIFYTGETTERDNLKQQLTDAVTECMDIEKEIFFRKIGKYPPNHG